MKVEIVTLHRITNFGSMLQTYATQTAIEKLGYEAEVLDFVPEGIYHLKEVVGLRMMCQYGRNSSNCSHCLR